MAEEKKQFSQNTDELEEAEETVNPYSSAAHTISMGGWSNGLNISSIIQSLKNQTALVNKGDISFIEDALVAQANSLDVIFNHLMQKSLSVDVYSDVQMKYMEILSRLALKAQNQCRNTLETLARIKNPPHLAFVQQQNVAYQQQVNNVSPVSTLDSQSSHMEKNKISPNELLEEENVDERLDFGTKSAAIRVDTPGEPWKQSTGPKTSEGKAKTSRNSYKHGIRSRETIILLQTIGHWVSAKNSVKKPRKMRPAMNKQVAK